MPGVQGQERDAAEAGDDEPRYWGPQHEGAGGAVRQVRLNFYNMNLQSSSILLRI